MHTLADQANGEHSTIRVEFLLKRHIGDYVLNVYVLHIFLLALCLASFWISVSNIVLRMSLSIIILIIIKFQTIQSFKAEHHLVSALSVWTFGLSCLVILSLLGHILSYYSVQHKWNDLVLDRLVVGDQPLRTGRQSNNRQPASANLQSFKVNYKSTAESIPLPGGNGTDSPTSANDDLESNCAKQRLQRQWNHIKQSCLLRLNSIIVNNTKNEGYDKINLVDMISRVVLAIIYVLFIFIYFTKYVF